MAANAVAGGAALAPVVHHQITSISVDLGVTTPDGLRHIDFGLEKDTDDDGSITWMIDFKFQERDDSGDPFTDVVTLQVTVKAAHNDAAEATATAGLSDGQVSHLNGPVTAAAELVKQNLLSVAKQARIVEDTLAKRDS